MKRIIGSTIVLLLCTGIALAEGRWAEAVPTPPGGEGVGEPAGRQVITDPIGDTFGVNTLQHDIIEFRGERNGSDLIITLVFAEPIGRPSASRALHGFVDIDSDRNPNTGVGGIAVVNCGQAFAERGSGLGVDWIVEIASYNPQIGMMRIRTHFGAGSTSELVEAAFAQFSVTITIPFSVIGTVDGVVDMAATMGTSLEPTDCAPDTGAMTVPVEFQSFFVE